MVAKYVETAHLEVHPVGADALRLVVQGRLDADSCAWLWKQARHRLEKMQPKHLTVDAAGVDYCDGAGASLFFNLAEYQKRGQRGFELKGLAERIQHLLALFDPGEPPPPVVPKGTLHRGVEDVGKAVATLGSDMLVLVAFTGELTWGLVRALVHPRRVRWKDAFLVMERAGCDAVGVITAVSFLYGLILAFQAAIPLQKFGAMIFAVDLVSLVTTREMGPLITAILLAGRTGSAFAAELGTMKVNEELNALDTMALEPVPFLVVPRVVATVLMTPLLVILSNVTAIVGALLVMRSLGFTWVMLINQLQQAVSLGDLFGGLFKSLFFGVLIAAIGCLRGLETAMGAQAVGVSATRAVVSGIFLIILVDSVFSIVFYVLGI